MPDAGGIVQAAGKAVGKLLKAGKSSRPKPTAEVTEAATAVRESAADAGILPRAEAAEPGGAPAAAGGTILGLPRNILFIGGGLALAGLAAWWFLGRKKRGVALNPSRKRGGRRRKKSKRSR